MCRWDEGTCFPEGPEVNDQYHGYRECSAFIIPTSNIPTTGLPALIVYYVLVVTRNEVFSPPPPLSCGNLEIPTGLYTTESNSEIFQEEVETVSLCKRLSDLLIPMLGLWDQPWKQPGKQPGGRLIGSPVNPFIYQYEEGKGGKT